MIALAELQAKAREREEARNAALDADPEVIRARAAYASRLEEYDDARRELEAASYRLGEETRRVLFEIR